MHWIPEVGISVAAASEATMHELGLAELLGAGMTRLAGL